MYKVLIHQIIKLAKKNTNMLLREENVHIPSLWGQFQILEFIGEAYSYPERINEEYKEMTRGEYKEIARQVYLLTAMEWERCTEVSQEEKKRNVKKFLDKGGCTLEDLKKCDKLTHSFLFP